MLQVKGLTKTYPSFKLDNVSFNVPSGYITGFIGANGAGKTTTLKSIMNIVCPDSGEVKIFGKSMETDEKAIKQNIGYLSGAINTYPQVKVSKYLKTTSSFYDNWQESVCEDYLKKFNIDTHKRLKELSQGMKVKLGLAIALSHGASLFILDEPTAGLDPVAREEILDIFSDLVNDGDKCILFSTHITSDLEKVADYILFIKEGIIVAHDTKDGLLDNYRVISGSLEHIDKIASVCIGLKKNRFGFSALVKLCDCKYLGQEYTQERPTLEDIMVYFERGSKND